MMNVWMAYRGIERWRLRLLQPMGRIGSSIAAFYLGLSVLATTGGGAAAGGPHAQATPPPVCQQPGASGSRAPTARPPSAATSLATIAEAYTCVLAHYPAGASLDDRTLLHGALVGMTGYLAQQGLDQTNATLPALTGDRAADWRAFSRAYAAIAQRLPQGADVPQSREVQQGLAAAAISGLVASLNDDHAHYVPSVSSPTNTGKRVIRVPSGAPRQALAPPALGIRTSYPSHPTPAPAAPPLFILTVDPGSPADRAGLRPGDIIAAIDGAPPFSGGVANQGVITLLGTGASVQLTIQRPATGRTMTVHLTPASYAPPPLVSAHVLAGNIAYVQVRQFAPGVSDQVFAALRALGLGRRLAGIVLDLRGNGGGVGSEPPRLLGAFAHDATITRFDDGRGHHTTARTDDRVPLLHVPLVALIDRGCASACDATAAAIHDLHLGRLVGERTSGAVSGLADLFGLDDGSLLELPITFMTGPAGEIVDGIGTPPDDSAPVTAASLSTGHDPGIEQALTDLQGMQDPMIDIGGYHLHLHCTGSGSPTVILDSGAGDNWTAWSRVQPALSRTTRVCSYDRAGEGLSDYGPTPRTSARMVAELRTLLQRAHIPGPYVLVGHSLGGTNMQLYTFTHQAEVGGLVLVDTAKGLPKPRAQSGGSTHMVIVAPGGPRGATGRAPTSSPHGAGAEEANVAQTDFAEVAAAQHAFGALPLIVITHAAPPPSSPADANKALANEALLAETQRQDAQIAHLSSNSEQILALRSGHYIQQDQPEVVIDAVRQVVDAVRHHAALLHRGQVLRAG